MNLIGYLANKAEIYFLFIQKIGQVYPWALWGLI